ncbi:MAG: hypothetical protein INQ03_16760 [Candidatus Heimdallarchaeota archaeon]|nr:hypothetical protein [Candidatus Heimdallarchaeota archaeon]
MSDNFDQMLRLNILEMLNSSKTILNIKRYSDADLMVQLEGLYRFAAKKPDQNDLMKAIDFLLQRSLVESSKMGVINVFAITEIGRETLSRIADGDDTVIY